MTIRRLTKKGFTLVEILIVVIILGILAAIVIPQFTNASQDARKSSLTSQLQTIRSQLALSGLQHRDVVSPALYGGGTGLVAWDQLIKKTSESDWTATGTMGPYFTNIPTNPLNGGSAVVVVAADPAWDASVTGGTSATGWVYVTGTGKIFATTKTGTKVYNETDGSNANN